MKTLANSILESVRREEINFEPGVLTKGDLLKAMEYLKIDTKYVKACLEPIDDDDVIAESECNMMEACKKTALTIRNRDIREVFRYFGDYIDCYSWEDFCDDMDRLYDGKKPELM